MFFRYGDLTSQNKKTIGQNITDIFQIQTKKNSTNNFSPKKKNEQQKLKISKNPVISPYNSPQFKKNQFFNLGFSPLSSYLSNYSNSILKQPSNYNSRISEFNSSPYKLKNSQLTKELTYKLKSSPQKDNLFLSPPHDFSSVNFFFFNKNF